jgi:PAS domain S-box-containing protein
MMRFIRQILDVLDVPSTDPDDRRRARLLNILLLGSLLISLLAILAAVIIDVNDMVSPEQIPVLYWAPILLLVGIITVYAINRHGSGGLASGLFLLLLIVLLAHSDQPQEVADGRSLLLFAVPIVMASVIFRPYTSFIAAALVSVVITAISLRLQSLPNPFAMLAFFAIALVSWLSARSLERALKDLRTINRELDQRVEERTQEVAKALGENRAVLRGIADGVIVFDNDGRAVVANPAIAGLVGRPPDQIVGCHIETLMDDGVEADDRDLVTSLLRQGETRRPSVRFDWGDKTLSASVAPVRLASGERIGVVAVFRDFTHEAEIDRMRSAFVSSASHELRTPLNAILGFADMLREGVYGPLSEGQRRATERIMANTGHLLSLASNLLDQAQMEAGRLKLNLTSFAPADVMDSVQAMMGVLAHAKGLELTSHLTADVPARVSGDRQRVHQILVNLVDNGIKFTERGTVHVRAYRPDAAHWALEVADSGCGISPGAQAHIFEPFQQVDGSATRGQDGFGLGLSIVRQLVDMMGGEITLTSEVGRGSTFTVVLPIASTWEGSPWATDLR